MNPDESVHCGMCGSELAHGPTLTKKQAKKDNYEKKIADGSLRDAFSFGYTVWLRELFGFIAGTILFLISASIVWGLSHLVTGVFGPLSILINFMAGILIVSFGWGVASRAYLDAVRERKVNLGRAINESLKNLLPVSFVCLIFAIGVGLTAGIYWLWTGPVMLLRVMDLPVSSGYFEFMLGIWVLVAGILLLIPAVIWLPLLTQLAIFRVLDRRSSPWGAPIWAINQIVHYHWELFWLCVQEFFGHVIGFVICYVGLIGTIPLAGVQNAAVYDWLRLNGDEPEVY